MAPSGLTKDYPEFKAVFRCSAHPIANLNTVIHGDDEMFLYTLTAYEQKPEEAVYIYFSQGFRMLNLVCQILEWNFGQFDNISAFLDFACGYGRFTRFLVSRLPSERIWVSDIYQGSVVFQREQFGVNGIVSVAPPNEYACDQRFDCIYVASLFSHLPEATFTAWLRKLFSLLKPEGIIVFSVHDETLLPAGVSMPPDGILFIPESESRSLDKNQYGATLVTEAYVRKATAEACGRVDSYCRLPRGLLDFQDVYIVSKSESVDFSTLQIDPGPRGYIEQCSLSEPGELKLGGWTADFAPKAFITGVEIWIDGKLAHRCLPFLDRPDVAKYFNRPGAEMSGWESFCHWNGNLDSLLVVKACSNFGAEEVIDWGSIEYFLGKNSGRDVARWGALRRLR
jgi:SAM-dependent methyltransferase